MVKRLVQVPVDAKDRPQSPIVISSCGELELRRPKLVEQTKRMFAICFNQVHHVSLGSTQGKVLKIASATIVAPDHVVQTTSVAVRSRKCIPPNQNPNLRTLKSRRERSFPKRRKKNMMRAWSVKNKREWQMLNAKSWNASNAYMGARTQHKVSASKVYSLAVLSVCNT